MNGDSRGRQPSRPGLFRVWDFAPASVLGCALAAGMTIAQSDTAGFSPAAAHLRTARMPKVAAARTDVLSASPLLPRFDDLTPGWAGYVAHGTYTSAQGTWTVPKVSWINYPTNPKVADPPTDPQGRIIQEVTSAWVGIGGWGETVLIQLGTWHIAAHDAATGKDSSHYAAWYELYPADTVTLTAHMYEVQPGDRFTASLHCTVPCTAGGRSTWSLSMIDQTRWKTPFTIQVQNPHTILATAEWIMEDSGAYPGQLATVAYLPNYEKVTFSALTANGANPNLSRAQQANMVVDPEGKAWSVVSDPVGGNSFTVSFVPPLSP